MMMMKGDFKMENFIRQETSNFLNMAEQLGELELNFRKYIGEKGLSEESYRIASREYSEKIQIIKAKVQEVEEKLNNYEENSEYVGKELLSELNEKLGRIWRIIVANETFCNEYGGVQIADEENLYKEIYDKHLVELKEFMYYFIKICNTLFSK